MKPRIHKKLSIKQMCSKWKKRTEIIRQKKERAKLEKVKTKKDPNTLPQEKTKTVVTSQTSTKIKTEQAETSPAEKNAKNTKNENSEKTLQIEEKVLALHATQEMNVKTIGEIVEQMQILNAALEKSQSDNDSKSLKNTQNTLEELTSSVAKIEKRGESNRKVIVQVLKALKHMIYVFTKVSTLEKIDDALIQKTMKHMHDLFNNASKKNEYSESTSTIKAANQQSGITKEVAPVKKIEKQRETSAPSLKTETKEKVAIKKAETILETETTESNKNES
eukprot:jgi/Bigna1/129973/aug1.10_g4681